MTKRIGFVPKEIRCKCLQTLYREPVTRSKASPGGWVLGHGKTDCPAYEARRGPERFREMESLRLQLGALQEALEALKRADDYGSELEFNAGNEKDPVPTWLLTGCEDVITATQVQLGILEEEAMEAICAK